MRTPERGDRVRKWKATRAKHTRKTTPTSPSSRFTNQSPNYEEIPRCGRYRLLSHNPGFAASDARQFGRMAVADMCPEFIDLTN